MGLSVNRCDFCFDRYDGAENLYQKALKCNPELVSCRRQYSAFLVTVRKNPAAAAAVLQGLGVD